MSNISCLLDPNILREMLNKHKDLPLVFLVESEVVQDDGGYWFGFNYLCHEGEVLDCEQDINPERTYTDRDEFLEDVEDYVYTTAEKELSDEELEARTEEIYKKYDPYWKKALLVYVTT